MNFFSLKCLATGGELQLQPLPQAQPNESRVHFRASLLSHGLPYAATNVQHPFPHDLALFFLHATNPTTPTQPLFWRSAHHHLTLLLQFTTPLELQILLNPTPGKDTSNLFTSLYPNQHQLTLAHQQLRAFLKLPDDFTSTQDNPWSPLSSFPKKDTPPPHTMPDNFWDTPTPQNTHTPQPIDWESSTQLPLAPFHNDENWDD